MDISPSSSDRLRRAIEQELDLQLRDMDVAAAPRRSAAPRPYTSTLPRTTPRAARSTAWPLDFSDDSASDTEAPRAVPGLRSPGNHSLFLATPRRSPSRERAPPARRAGGDDVDISRLAALGAAEDSSVQTTHDSRTRPRRLAHELRRAASEAPSRHSSASRHSSNETMVNSDASQGAPLLKTSERAPRDLPESMRWADAQLGALATAVHAMEREMAHLRERTPRVPHDATAHEAPHEAPSWVARLEALELRVDAQGRRLDEVRRALRQPPSDAGPSREPPLGDAEPLRGASAVDDGTAVRESAAARENLATRADAPPASPPPPSYVHELAREIVAQLPSTWSTDAPRLRSPPWRARRADLPRAPRVRAAPGWDDTIRRLQTDVHELARAVRELQATPSAWRRAAPPMPLTPPLEDAPRTAADDAEHDDTLRRRYEQICRSVADALGMAPMSPSAPSSSSRRDEIQASLRQREADEAAGQALLERLQRAPHEAATLSAADLRRLEQLLALHEREFVHQKALYCELADELKDMEPSMDPTKRRILAEHVHESIDALEAEATRIHELHTHLARARRARSEG